MVCVHGDAEVARTAEDGSVCVVIIGGEDRAILGVHATRLRNFLIDNAIELLFGIQMVMAVEYGGHAILNQQLVDWHRPSGPLCGEACGAVRVKPTPLVERSGLDAAAHLSVESADQVVHEDEFEGRGGVGECLLEPLILAFAEGHVPWVVAGWDRGFPVGIEHDKQGVSPLP